MSVFLLSSSFLLDLRLCFSPLHTLFKFSPSLVLWMSLCFYVSCYIVLYEPTVDVSLIDLLYLLLDPSIIIL